MFKNTELGRPELPAGSVTVSKPRGPKCLVNTSGAGASKSPKSSRLGKGKSKWSYKENTILWECYIKCITPFPTGYMRIHQLWVQQKRMGLSSQRLAVQIRNIKSKIILSRVKREEVIAYVSNELLNETLLQSFTGSIGDTPNVKVADNEINIGISEYEMRQEELGVENEVVRITEAVANVEGIYIVTTKEGASQVNAEERLVLERLKEMFETKVHIDIPSVKNID